MVSHTIFTYLVETNQVLPKEDKTNQPQSLCYQNNIFLLYSNTHAFNKEKNNLVEFLTIIVSQCMITSKEKNPPPRIFMAIARTMALCDVHQAQ